MNRGEPLKCGSPFSFMEDNMGTNFKRIYIIDYLKALAIIFVILIHSLPESTKSNFIVVYVFRMAVPIFILVSGYNYAMSITRKKHISAWYAWPQFFKKIVELIIPFFIVYCLYIAMTFANGQSITLRRLYRVFLLATYGQGSYYLLLIIRLMVFFPLFYIIIKRYREKGVLFIALTELTLTVLTWIFPIPVHLFRISSFRYFTMLALGCYTFIYKEKLIKSKFLMLSFLVGVGYLLAFCFLQLNTAICKYTPWENTNLFTCLYIYPIFYLALTNLNNWKIKNRYIHNIIVEIGQSTWYILCVQMIWFWKSGALYLRLKLPTVLQLIVNVVVACFFGCLINIAIKRIKAKMAQKK